MTKTRQYQLLSIVAVLVIIKFVVQPILEWQNETLDNIAVSERRLESGLDAIEKSDEYELKAIQLGQELSNSKGGLMSFVGANAFQLEQQTAFENIASQHNITVESASWSPMQTMDNGILEHRLDVTLIGDTEDIIALQAQLELENENAMVLTEYNFVITRHLQFSLGTVRGQATVSFFMEPEGGL
ncbi:hypothetical protein DEU29_102137 [Idiomarina aquatica]|uniref:General secretion pathway protein M n=1 Tax=Idiomarina aquatica TaxID=1327752 RepID=A0A4R6PSX8_9GAMM|nr:hypothetical protein [Idiomarina aquatica]TDP40237.1 hypothetical protein DEU29_102137 [Idiomarina aquatica]